MNWKDYLPEHFKETYDYANRLWRGGLTNFPPLIVTCAITGGNAGKEINPGLPELLEEQVEQSWEAYQAGASMVHIHRRDPGNPCEVTDNPELYREVNREIRKRCPDLILNNTAIGGRFKISDTELSAQSWTSIYADPEVASLDISNYCSIVRLPKREPPLFGRDEPVMREWGYSITQTEVLRTLELMDEHNVKPEFECFQMSDLMYTKRIIDAGYTDKRGGPNLIQFVYTPGGSNWPTMDYMVALKNAVPRGCQLGIIAAGAQQFPLLAMAICQGFHVRVGMEDNVYLEKGRLAQSNGELVEKIVTIAKLLGRPVATPAQAREMLGLGEPRTW